MKRLGGTRLAGGIATAVAILLALPVIAVAAQAPRGSWVPVSVAPLPTVPALPTIAPLLPTVPPLPTIAPLPTVGIIGPLPTMSPPPSALPSGSQAASASSWTPSPSPQSGGTTASAPGKPPPSLNPSADTQSEAPFRGTSHGPSGQPDAGSRAIQASTAATLAAAGLVTAAAVATGLAIAHLLGVGLATLGGAFSAVAAALDRRGRRVRAVIGAIPGFEGWGVNGLAIDAEDPILAAMKLRPMAGPSSSEPRASAGLVRIAARDARPGSE